MTTAKKRRPAGAPAAAAPVAASVPGLVTRRRPAECRKHLRTAVAGAFDEIVSGFLEQAKSGSCQHVKMVLELMKPAKRVRAPKGSAQLMLEELEKEFGPLE